MDSWGSKMVSAVELVSEIIALGFGLEADAFTSRLRMGPHLLGPTGEWIDGSELNFIFGVPLPCPLLQSHTIYRHINYGSLKWPLVWCGTNTALRLLLNWCFNLLAAIRHVDNLCIVTRHQKIQVWVQHVSC